MRIVRHHDDRRAEFRIQTLQHRQNIRRRLAIQIARGLIGHDQHRISNDGARDRHPLLLPTRKL